jgi:Uma2 family endonuclease
MAEMIHSPAKTYTVDEFWNYVHLPENAGRRLELVNGMIVDKNESTQLTAVISGRISYFLNQYVIPRECGYVTGAMAYYALSTNDLCSPDVAYLSKEKHPTLSGDFFPLAPDIVIEIIKPNTKAVRLHEKISTYADGGASMVWEVYPTLKSINIMYYPIRKGKSLANDDILDCGDILPGFEVKVSDIFPK